MRKLKFLRRIPAAPFYGVETAASATEQTGLMPTVPGNEWIAESYESLYPVHKQKPKDERKI